MKPTVQQEYGSPSQTSFQPTPEDRLAWYRERDKNPADLHRRYVRAKYQIGGWSDQDVARFHRYRRSLSRENAARLVIARRVTLRA
ncbi:MAG: hypothetical protein IPK82_23995 [Polyangiaceae bacterium]|nr:hypothetical protein [Polyangiaceae bacterium]